MIDNYKETIKYDNWFTKEVCGKCNKKCQMWMQQKLTCAIKLWRNINGS